MQLKITKLQAMQVLEIYSGEKYKRDKNENDKDT